MPNVPKLFLARKLSKHEDGRYRPKHVVFTLLIQTIIQPYIHSCVLTEFTSPYSLNTQRGWHTSEDGTPQRMAHLRGWHTSEDGTPQRMAHLRNKQINVNTIFNYAVQSSYKTEALGPDVMQVWQHKPYIRCGCNAARVFYIFVIISPASFIASVILTIFLLFSIHLGLEKYLSFHSIGTLKTIG